MTQYNRTFLSIDYGSRRIGLAKSDPTGMIASALKTLEVRSVADALAQLEQAIHDYEPNGLVVGYPLLQSGDKSDKCREIDTLIDRLKQFYTGPIHRVDEQYTSQEAADIVHAHGKKVGQDKRRLDRLAAVVILQRFLDELPPAENSGV
jgi:putative Holliday junction resolvase